MVSVIIPVYNGENYIQKAIESLLNQTYKNIEIIVVDDGSTDRTAEIVNNYREVKYFYQNNSGPSAARNLGIFKSEGQFIALQDADDVSLPNRIEKQREVFERYSDIEVVYNPVHIIDEKENVIDTLRSEGIYENKNDFFAMTLFRQLIPCPPSIMLRRHCFNKVKYSEEYINAEDYLFTIDLSKQFKFKYIDDILYLYRRHSGNLTNKHNKQVENEIRITKDFGIENIICAVNNTSFSKLEQKFLLSKIFIKIRRFDKAISLLESMVQEYDNEYIWFYLGVCYYESDNIGKAKKCFEVSLKQNGFLAEAYNNLGCCFALQKDKKQAVTCYNSALKLKEGYNDPTTNMELLSNNSNKFKITSRELRNVLSKYK